MSIVHTQKSALTSKPLKTSQATGAALATMGFAGAMPLIHGSQGCSAFSKVFLISHFREPFPIQNTAVDQVAAVMGTEDNLETALKNLCQDAKVQCISVLTTGLVEMQGCDIWRIIANFKSHHPQWAHIDIVPVSTPDFKGTIETGFAKLVESVVKQCVDPSPTQTIHNQINVICSVSTTTADIELLERYLAAFDLEPIFLPNIADSLDGHLDSDDHSTTSTGGTSISAVKRVSSSGLTLVLGESGRSLAKWLEIRFSTPYLCVNQGIRGTDQFLSELSHYTGLPVPKWIERGRKRLQDAMLDTHFVLSNSPIAIASEPDLAYGLYTIFKEVGVSFKSIITSYPAKWCDTIVESVTFGDLSHLEPVMDEVKIIFGNSHIQRFTKGKVPLVKVGYPCHDQFGNTDLLQFGYEGARAQIFRVANLLLDNQQQEVAPHISQYKFEPSEVAYVGA